MILSVTYVHEYAPESPRRPHKKTVLFMAKNFDEGYEEVKKIYGNKLISISYELANNPVNYN